jgi:hypothetical protein
MQAAECAGFAGRVQIKTPGASRESWLWLAAGAGATGCESGADLAAQQGMTPCWQQARTCLAQADGAGGCAANSGVPASRKLQRMASANFIVLILTSFCLFTQTIFGISAPNLGIGLTCR